MTITKSALIGCGIFFAAISLSGCSSETSTNEAVDSSVVMVQPETSDQSNALDRPKEVPSSNDGVSSLSAKEHCEAVMASVADAGFEGEVWVTCLNDRAHIHSDSYASHQMMTGIVGTIEQLAVPAPGYFAPIMFNPAFSGEPQTRDSSLAIAVNGVPIFDYSSGGELSIDELYYHQPHLGTISLQEVDNCGGHAGMGDDYHYHELPRCMLEQMANKNENPIIG